MKIKVSELRSMAGMLFDHLEATGHVEIDVEEDFYWNIPAKERYAVYEVPSKHDMGQLSDDWQELQKIGDGRAEPVNMALVWFAAILRRIGERAIG
jgi:hypothetical protein